MGEPPPSRCFKKAESAPARLNGGVRGDWRLRRGGRAKVLVKAGTLAGKCYALALKAAFKSVSLGGDGSLDSATQAKVTACFNRATTASNTAMDELDQTTYCASPSGAFLAGADAR